MSLYFLVFGESLLNDGVTVVLYNTIISLERMPVILISDIFMAVLSFFFVAFGGFLIGVFIGMFATLITTTTKHARVVEPLVIFICAYLAFICAELIHWSGK